MDTIHYSNVVILPDVNETANQYFTQVIGNKLDASSNTEGQASVVALLRYIIANLSSDADVEALIGKLDTVAHTGVTDNVTTLVGYIKQLITDLIAIKGIGWTNENLTTIDSLIDTILADTNELQTDWTNGGRLDLILDEITTQGDTNETKIDTIDTVVDAIKLKTDNLPADTSTEIAKIVADTNELQGDWTNGGRLDLILDEITTQGDTNETKIDAIGIIVDAIKLKTDNLPADTSTEIAKIVADTNELQGDWTNAGRLDLILDEITTQGDTNETKIDALKLVADTINVNNSSNDSSGTFSYLDVGGEQDIIELVTTKRIIIHGIWLDLTSITQNGALIKVYHKIDGTNYREILAQRVIFNQATDGDAIYLNLNLGITSDFKVTFTEGSDEGVNRDIIYSIVYETKE